MSHFTLTAPAAGKPSAGVWTGRAFSALFVLFMLFDIGIKLIGLSVVDDTMLKLGWEPGYGRLIGSLELIFLILYLYPRTAVLGAVLMTGLFGGAIATHVRVADPLFSHVLFGVYLALFMWGGLWLRDARLRDLFPLGRDV